MKWFAVYVPEYTRLDPTYFHLRLRPIRSFEAWSATHALRLAKAAGYGAPIIGQVKGPLQ